MAFEAVSIARPTIFAALFDTLVETSIQSGLTQLERATVVAVIVVVPTSAIAPIPVTIVVAIPTISVVCGITFRVISVFERFTEVAAIEFAIAEA